MIDSNNSNGSNQARASGGHKSSPSRRHPGGSLGAYTSTGGVSASQSVHGLGGHAAHHGAVPHVPTIDLNLNGANAVEADRNAAHAYGVTYAGTEEHIAQLTATRNHLEHLAGQHQAEIQRLNNQISQLNGRAVRQATMRTVENYAAAGITEARAAASADADGHQVLALADQRAAEADFDHVRAYRDGAAYVGTENHIRNLEQQLAKARREPHNEQAIGAIEREIVIANHKASTFKQEQAKYNNAAVSSASGTDPANVAATGGATNTSDTGENEPEGVNASASTSISSGDVPELSSSLSVNGVGASEAPSPSPDPATSPAATAAPAPTDNTNAQLGGSPDTGGTTTLTTSPNDELSTTAVSQPTSDNNDTGGLATGDSDPGQTAVSSAEVVASPGPDDQSATAEAMSPDGASMSPDDGSQSGVVATSPDDQNNPTNAASQTATTTTTPAASTSTNSIAPSSGASAVDATVLAQINQLQAQATQNDNAVARDLEQARQDREKAAQDLKQVPAFNNDANMYINQSAHLHDLAHTAGAEKVHAMDEIRSMEHKLEVAEHDHHLNGPGGAKQLRNDIAQDHINVTNFQAQQDGYNHEADQIDQRIAGDRGAAASLTSSASDLNNQANQLYVQSTQEGQAASQERQQAGALQTSAVAAQTAAPVVGPTASSYNSFNPATAPAMVATSPVRPPASSGGVAVIGNASPVAQPSAHAHKNKHEGGTISNPSGAPVAYPGSTEEHHVHAHNPAHTMGLPRA